MIVKIFVLFVFMFCIKYRISEYGSDLEDKLQT